jgi:hypothetical protein
MKFSDLMSLPRVAGREAEDLEALNRALPETPSDVREQLPTTGVSSGFTSSMIISS